jgi:dihydrofolate synthase/folylpolyglutamate synthase
VDFVYDYEPGRVTSEAISDSRVRVAGTQFGARRADASPLAKEPWLQLSLLGEHQAANAAVSVTVVERLREMGLQLPNDAVRTGLADVNWPARLEVVGRRPLVILDCAHNVASAMASVQTLEASFPEGRRLLIFACSADKDLAGIFGVLVPQFQHVLLTAYTTITRAVAPGRLAEILRGVADVPYTICPRPADAWRAASATACPDDLICITGSVFLAGELRPLLLSGREHELP